MNIKKIQFLLLSICLLADIANASSISIEDGVALLNAHKYSEAMTLFKDLANQNDARAQGLLARMYGNGWGTEPNPKEAFYWASKGALKNDPVSQSIIAYMYRWGQEIKLDKDEAILWYKKAADQGDSRSVFMLAEIYSENKEVAKSIDLLNLVEDDVGTIKERTDDHEFFSQRKGLAELKLGDAYLSTNPEKSFLYYKKASLNNNALAQHLLAECYQDGFGTQKDFKEAFRWMLEASKNGDATANYWVGIYYLAGLGVSQNTSQAVNFLKLALSIPNETSQYAKRELAKIFLLELYDYPKNKEEGRGLVLSLIDEGLDVSTDEMVVLMTEAGIENVPKNTRMKMLEALNDAKVGSTEKAKYIFLEAILYGRLSMPALTKIGWMQERYKDNHNESLLKMINEEINKLTSKEKDDLNKLTFVDLITQTENYLAERNRLIGPLEPTDLIDEGWHQFLGLRGKVNEPLAQYLIEEALRLAISVGDSNSAATARNDLGAILDDSANLLVRNKRLAMVHLYDGFDSEYAPGNLLLANYLGRISLSSKEFSELNERYYQKNDRNDPTQSLAPIPNEIKSNPAKVYEFLSGLYNKTPNPDVANYIANYIEDNNDVLNLALRFDWDRKAFELGGFSHREDSRTIRAKKILAGDYVKDLPSMNGAVANLFNLRSDTRGISPTQVAPSAPKKEELVKGKSMKLFALVIGNSAYETSKLANPVSDAKGVANKLKGYGFTVTNLNDVTRNGFVSALIDFTEKAKGSDVTVLFYSGHGMQMGGVNYLLPTDINFSANEELVVHDGISLNDILLYNLPGKTRVVFIDACRTKPFRTAKTRGVADGLAPMNVATGTMISFATRDGGVAFDGTGSNNSPYTSALLKHLGEDEDVALMLRSVRDDVLASTNGKQEPWEYGALSGGKLVIPKLAH